MSTPRYTPEQYLTEYNSFLRSLLWELQNIKAALDSFSWLNTAEQWARLQAVSDIVDMRRNLRG